MTTRSDSLPLLLAPSGGFPWRRVAFSFVLTLLAVALFAYAFAVGYVRLHEDRVLPGVEVAGVALAGLDRGAAETRLREALPSLSSGHLTVRFGDRQETIAYSDIGRDYNVSLMIDQAFSVGREGSVLEQIQEQLRILMHGVTVEPSLNWNSEALAERVAAIAAPAQIEPIDATVAREQGRYTVQPAVPGQSVDVEEGIRLAAAAVNNLSAADTRVTVKAVPVAPAVSTEQARQAVERVERVAGQSLTVTGGGAGLTIDAEQIRGWVRLEEQSAGAWTVVIERDPLVQLAQQMAADVDQPAINSTFAFDGDEVTAVAGQEGQLVDVEATADAMLAALQARVDGGGPPSVNLAMTVVQPDFTYEEAQSLVGRVEKLSSWKTKYVPGPMNYNGRNISIPTEDIDGMVLEPGQTFDFWDVVGEPTVGDGYGPGGAIIRGRTVPDGALAGGICSTSTTIFNAALRAGLEMGARKNHYYYISRYPVGLDATVWIGNSGARQTMSFTNDMEYPILVRGINKRGAVIFEIWGVPDGRTVDFSKAKIDNRKPAHEVLRYTDNLAAGKRKRVEYPANGFDASVSRVVRGADGELIHRDSYRSRYAMIKGITLVGRSEGDPPHGTETRRGGSSGS